MDKSRPIHPKIPVGTIAAISASLMGQGENLRSEGQLIDFCLKPNRYREQRIKEYVNLAIAIYLESEAQALDCEECKP